MSFQMMTWAIEQEVPERGPAHLLLILANYASPEGECWPSQETLATDCKATDRTIRTELAKLESWGFIRREKRRQNGRQGSDLIALQYRRKDLPAEASRRKNTTVPGGKIRQFQAERFSGNPISRTSQEPKNPPTPQGISPPDGDGLFEIAPLRAPKPPDPFPAWWEAYPRKVGKIAAEKKYRTALKIAPAEKLLAGAIRYRDDPKRKPDFTKHPSTWLKAGCWEDAYTDAEGSAPAVVIRNATDILAEIYERNRRHAS